jgi:hypothetical protein
MSRPNLLTMPTAWFGTWLASVWLMTDDNYFAVLVWTICMLMFACGVVALSEHPEWFGA